MPRVTAKNLERLRALVELRLDAVRLVSFDVFDTLLARRIEPPEAVHRAVARFLATEVGDRLDADRVLAARYQEERRLREEAHSRGLDFECHYDDLLQRWLRHITGAADPDLIERVRRREMDLELDALVVKPGARETLESVAGRGATVLAVSDMYLAAGQVREILDAKGLLEFFGGVYVSSETKLCKYSGRLFRLIVQEHGCQPEEMVHAGDNAISDHDAPRRVGIQAIHLKEPKEQRRRAVLGTYARLAEERHYWRGAHLLEVSSAFGTADFRHRDFFFRYGHDVLGPIFCSYVQGVIERIQRFHPHKVLFLARDGFLFDKLYHRLVEEGVSSPTVLPSTEYVYLSRQVAVAASIAGGLRHREAVVALYNPKQQGLYSILRVFGLPVEEFASLAAQHGFQEIREPLKDWSDARLRRFLADRRVQERVRLHAERNRQLLRFYLEQVGFFSHPSVAFVDIGWNGTIQSAIERAYGSDIRFPKMYGLYFAYSGGIPYQFGPRSEIEGLIFDRRRQLATERVCINFEELFEEAARSPEATTVGYRQVGRGGAVVPVLKDASAPDRLAEIECNPLVAALQAGVLEFATSFAAAQRLTGYSFEDIKPYVLTLIERAVAYPTREEVQQLTRLAHAEDFGADRTMDLSEVNPGRRRIGKWRFLAGQLRESNWRYGTLSAAGASWPRLVFRLVDILRLR